MELKLAGTKESKWATSFIFASIVQGLLAVVWTALIALPILTPSPSRVIAGGGGGTWFFVGYSTYLIVGVLGVALTALFYFYIESVLRKPYRGANRILAALHLILMNVGVAGATFLMMIGGYQAGAAVLPEAAGGKDWNAGQVHEFILGPLPTPISVFIYLAGLGALLGGLGYILAYKAKPVE